MGILDALLGNNTNNTTTDPKAALIGAAISMLAGGGGQQNSMLGGLGGLLSGVLGNQGGAGNALAALIGQASGGQSGLGGLLQVFQQSGMADQVQSWVSNNPNMPVSGAQVQQALGESGLLSKFAEQAQLSEGETANHLAEILPEVINSATPHGAIPEGGIDIASLAAKFLGK